MIQRSCLHHNVSVKPWKKLAYLAFDAIEDTLREGITICGQIVVRAIVYIWYKLANGPQRRTAEFVEIFYPTIKLTSQILPKTILKELVAQSSRKFYYFKSPLFHNMVQ